jgi:hypothetical protein
MDGSLGHHPLPRELEVLVRIDRAIAVVREKARGSLHPLARNIVQNEHGNLALQDADPVAIHEGRELSSDERSDLVLVLPIRSP